MSKNNMWTVDRLCASRKLKNKTQYLVAWKDYSFSDATWEPACNILDKSLVSDFLSVTDWVWQHTSLMGTPEDWLPVDAAVALVLEKAYAGWVDGTCSADASVDFELSRPRKSDPSATSVYKFSVCLKTLVQKNVKSCAERQLRRIPATTAAATTATTAAAAVTASCSSSSSSLSSSSSASS